MTPGREEGAPGGTLVKEREEADKTRAGGKKVPRASRNPAAAAAAAGGALRKSRPVREGRGQVEEPNTAGGEDRGAEKKLTPAERPGGAQEGTAAAAGPPPILPPRPPRGPTPARP